MGRTDDAPARARPRALLLATTVVVVVVVGAATACLTPSQERALDLVNADRSGAGMSHLPSSPAAARKAQAWAERLADEDDLYHSALTQGIEGRWCSFGENVGYGPTVAAVEHAYMASDTHRDNILDARWTAAGTGVARRGKKVWVVHEFVRAC